VLQVRYRIRLILSLSLWASCALLLSAGLSSCASSWNVADEYSHARNGKSDLQITTVVIVVDGLSSTALERASSLGNVSELTSFFSTTGPLNQFQGRASFPTLTYPNLVSIITGLPVSKSGIVGNHLPEPDHSILDLEDFRSWNELNRRIRPDTVFTRLSRTSQRSASLSYSVYGGATVHQGETLNAGLDYIGADYGTFDRATLDSLETLLRSTPVSKWPRFTFVHLIGVDGYSHKFGPNSKKAQNYLSELDHSLHETFSILRAGERSGQKLQVILTADHGFVETKKRIQIERMVQNIDGNVRVLPDNRIASIAVPHGWPSERLKDFAFTLSQLPNLEWTVVRFKDHLELFRHDGMQARIDYGQACSHQLPSARFTWIGGNKSTLEKNSTNANYYCLDAYDQGANRINLNYFVASLVEYFASPQAPDVLLLPDDNSDFVGDYMGNHGALTPEEIFVPILARGLQPRFQGTWPTWKILQLLLLDEPLP
jgi:hypothetical protein